jgi:hypothetical protein
MSCGLTHSTFIEQFLQFTSKPNLTRSLHVRTISPYAIAPTQPFNYHVQTISMPQFGPIKAIFNLPYIWSRSIWQVLTIHRLQNVLPLFKIPKPLNAFFFFFQLETWLKIALLVIIQLFVLNSLFIITAISEFIFRGEFIFLILVCLRFWVRIK